MHCMFVSKDDKIKQRTFGDLFAKYETIKNNLQIKIKFIGPMISEIN